ncbi:hypothetical protein J6590_039928 [Homalodisca vitripennis]|nr:hypothetical protein J6590_039928 [Homalodisca vitripennis]
MAFLIIGDLNINVMDLTDPLTQRLRDLLSSFDLNWSVKSPTRMTATSSTAIDNIITNIPYTTVSVLNTAISDHFAQEVVTGLINLENPYQLAIKQLQLQLAKQQLTPTSCWTL